jgi:hypothetical protein
MKFEHLKNVLCYNESKPTSYVFYLFISTKFIQARDTFYMTCVVTMNYLMVSFRACHGPSSIKFMDFNFIVTGYTQHTSLHKYS